MRQGTARRFGLIAVLAFAASPLLAQDQAQPDQSDAVSHGRYIATAGDCAACHQEPGKAGSPFGGGSPIASPVGPIYASNITPDKIHGIGAWTFEQFRDAMTKGESPTKGMLYPAMPYTSYAHMSDDDLRALYTYLMKGVAPSPHEPPETRLPFPFVRQAMRGWNLLFLHAGGAAGATAPAGSAERGHYVAEALEHCSSCHTPRSSFFAEDAAKLLSGTRVGNWYAPNITPDKSGIGQWTDQELTEFLTQGHNAHAVAGGDMGLAVERSLSKLQADDIRALVAYLRSVPAVSTPTAVGPPGSAGAVDVAAVEPQHPTDLATIADGGGLDGAQLYQSACASCHSANGGGSMDGKHPDLAKNQAVLMSLPDNLIMTIADGVHRTVNGHEYAMPGFSADLNNAQIGALATFVRHSIGGLKTSPAITADDVARVRSGDPQRNWLVRYASAMTTAGVLLLLVVVILLVRSRSNRHRRPTRR